MWTQDTSTGFQKWHALVLRLQLFGVFPYRMSETDLAPRFSISLFLWCVFVQVSTVWLCTLTVYELVLPFRFPNIGSTFLIASITALVLSQFLTWCLLLANSKKLATFMADLSTLQMLHEPVKESQSCSVRSALIMVCGILATAYGGWFSVVIAKVSSTLTVSIITFHFGYAYCSVMTVKELTNKPFELLSRQVLTAAETVVKSSMNVLCFTSAKLPQPPTVVAVSQADTEALLLSLHRMESKIFQVRHIILHYEQIDSSKQDPTRNAMHIAL